MRLGTVVWHQIIELRSRKSPSALDDQRLEALFRWVLPYYYGWTRTEHPLTAIRPAFSWQGIQGQGALSPSPSKSLAEQRLN